ncbi:MAG: helix-turn-helix transcriptional regulator [Oscillospiraceae bacterium]|nr:helix-turn-helix transcriptional regulator [Oscillospiraceae bacterium]
MSDTFHPTELEKIFDVTHIVTLHDFKYTRDFLFTGESHDFWEMAFIRRGSVGVMAGSSGYTLGAGEAIFHAPNEYHNIWANGDSAEVVIITFVCKSNAMKFFERRLLSLADEEIRIIESLLSLGEKTFSDPPDIIYQKKLNVNSDMKQGSLQLIKLKLEQLLILLLQNSGTIDRSSRKSEAAGSENERLITNAIIHTLTERIYATATLDEVCAGVMFSKSYLKKLFKNATGYSIMDYYTHLKIERAKILIKSGEMSVSEIAELLGYSSIHYFSRVFKKKTGLSPTEYKSALTSA